MPDNKSASSRDRAYDDDIRAHYDAVARTHKDSPASTMEDETVRAKETECIHRVVAAASRENPAAAGQRKLSVIDVGCGNGYTLETLSRAIPGNSYSGVEFNDSQRAVAVNRLASIGIAVTAGDLRRKETLPAGPFDVLICQRVLINLLDDGDQAAALENLVDLMAEGGVAVFIEAFQSSLENLNAARSEFELDPMPPAVHNLYLRDEFFSHPELEPWSSGSVAIDPDLLSTHYFVTRVFHEAILQATSTKFKRNSHFVRFWSRALPDGVGRYAPLRVIVVTKRKAGQ